MGARKRLCVRLLLAGAAAGIAVLAFVAPIPQDAAYHDFADGRPWHGVPNFMDTVSNLPFAIVGVLGIVWLARHGRRAFVDPGERWAFVLFFASVGAVGFGSAWYHLDPNNATLVWDRLPIAVGVMALVAAVVAERLDVRWGKRLVTPLAAIGVASVLQWHFTEQAGRGDLRFYAFVHYYPLVAVVLMIALGTPRYTRAGDYLVVIGWYALAKGFEVLDRPAYEVLGVVSGHTLKHLAAAMGTWWVLRMLRRREAVAG